MNKSNIKIGNNLLSNCGELISTVWKARKIAIVTDTNVAPLYLKTVVSSLEDSGFEVVSIILPAGEFVKSLDSYKELLEFLSKNEITRSDLLIALGGGSIGDLSGFTASTYLRGISYIQIPTTLLAMVDSSIGGKTGIDLPFGKNLCGAFYDPLLVIDDIDTLSTLSDDDFKNGLAEILKYGILDNKAIIELLKSDSYKENINILIDESIITKFKYCQGDEHDFGKRHFLNLGHTIGHAIEFVSNYEIPHGFAVSIGTCAMLRAFEAYGDITPFDARQIEDLYKKLELPTTCNLDSSELLKATLLDKKRSGQCIDIIVPIKIGACEIRTIDVSELQNIIRLGVN